MTDQWEEGYSRLLEYVETHSDARVPQPYKLGDYSLGAWVTAQRGNNSRGILEAERQHRLQTLPGWTWDPREDKWEQGFSQLLKYVEIHGDARVLQSYKLDDYPLGAWVGTQRTTYRTGRLEAARQLRLQGLPGWTWEYGTDQWEDGFRQLLDYVEIHGHARVPRSFKVDGHTLGQWVVTQRQKHAKGTLDADCEHRLEDVPGWTWDALMERWEQGFSRLVDYIDQHGHALVPVSYTVDDYPLGRWVSKQRITFTRGTLEADRQRRLEDLPSWTWDPHGDKWVDSNGDARVPRKYSIDGYQLGDWVTTQRQKYAKGTLDADREQRLQDVPGWTWKG